jgi:hypothetical protein
VLRHSPPFAFAFFCLRGGGLCPFFFFAIKSEAAHRGGKKNGPRQSLPQSGAVQMATFYYMDENRKAAKKIAFHFSFNFLRKDLVM